MNKQKLLTLMFFLGCVYAFAQPSNDECDTPIFLGDVTSYCSPIGAFTNVNATPSTYGPASCFGATQNDVWFAFTALATDVTITVRGATATAPGGTLIGPQMALYFGTCGGVINQLECQQGLGTNIAEGYQGGLFVGSTYLIRVQGAAGNEGTFQLCINNYNPPVEPTSDCPDASILCDKSPFVVQNVTGAGANNLEMEDAQCFENGVPGINESNSTWFVWTCDQSGTLEFTLSPNNLPDDLDFVVYRLPNGIGNCNNKQLLRCMASGEGPPYPSPCLGPTGLRAGDPDISEDAGCSEAGDDAWLRPLDMVSGETYALVVNNFSETGNGFSVEFGGTGTFLGPKADFNTIPEAVCLGIPVSVVDASTFPLGQIEAWKWSFGADAVPQTATGPGPHNVQFNTPGNHPVVLTLETDLGCKVTDIENVLIYPDVEIDTLVAYPDCNGTANGAVTINNITSGTPPYQFSWNGGPFSSNNSLNNLGVGVYTLVIRDSNNCESDFSIDVHERILTADPLVTSPLCFGDQNGVITLNVTNGKDPVQFNWGTGFIFSNSQGGFAAGTYTIQAIDNVLCKGTFTVNVTDNELLTLAIDTILITCNGANDGMAEVTPFGGVRDYTYTWSNGATTALVSDLGPGQYQVTLTDANNCTTVGSLALEDPEDIGIALLGTVDLRCNGIPEGQISVQGIGGRVPYQFSTDGETFVDSDVLTGLPAGDYWVQIEDAGGCRDSVFASILQPPALQVIAEPADTLVSLGFTVDLETYTYPGGRPVDFLWTPSTNLSDETDPEPTVTAVNDQVYIVRIVDEDQCEAFDTVIIRVRKDRPVYFPNIFKPEGATQYGNDFFTGYAGPAASQINLLRIYDRWGSLIYENRDFPLNEPNFGWDGTYKGDKMFGVFTWYAKVGFIDGEEVPFEGSITVLR
ncbi:MAG: gliding motility-associated C-terminal domain-containing protein [Saprospiraceae bacterium]|nr:gliding motility-associated C-terminal domain-containing protein [Saprospiraceae bacterium]